MKRRWINWISGWRGAVSAALVCGFIAAPGLVRLPVVDRAEASFAEGTAQMIDEGDYTAIRYQQRLRGGTAPGAHWAQAAVVQALTLAEDREIWAWRLPSLLGLMLAAGATAWGAASLFKRHLALPAGLIGGGSLLISTLGGLATADALFAGFSALALTGFARLYVGPGGPMSRIALWAGLIGAALVEGPMSVILALAALAVLVVADRGAPWRSRIGWIWGGLAFAAVIAPWIVAVTVATDGAFWSPQAAAQSGRVAFGVQTLALPLMLFPATALLPMALAYGWRRRGDPGVRVALACLIPSLLLLELAPDREIVDLAPLFPALAWLTAAALFEPAPALARWIGAALSALCGLVLAAFCMWLAARFGAGGVGVIAGLTAVLFAAAGGVAAMAVLRGWGLGPLAAAFGLSAGAHMLLLGALAPLLTPLWPARQMTRALVIHQLDPRQGIAIGPVASAGFAEPSLVFSLGPETETGDAADAAQAIAEGRPAIVDQGEDANFRARLVSRNLRAQAAQAVDGYDYVEGKPVRLTLYRSLEAPIPGAGR